MVQVPRGGNWLKAVDLVVGDICKILTEADWEASTYQGKEQNQFVCNVDYKGETRKMKLTMASCAEIAPVYGQDSKEWIGKELRLESIKVMAGGQIKNSIFATPVGDASKPQKDDSIAWDD